MKKEKYKVEHEVEVVKKYEFAIATGIITTFFWGSALYLGNYVFFKILADMNIFLGVFGKLLISFFLTSLGVLVIYEFFDRSKDIYTEEKVIHKVVKCR